MMSALVALLSKVVDYAGLFPPAKLDMDTTVRNYAEYLAGSQRWMLSKLIVPTGELGTFEEAAQDLLPQTSDIREAGWEISLVMPPASDEQKLLEAARQLNKFNQRHEQAGQGRARIVAAEIRLDDLQGVSPALEQIPPQVELFFEVPVDQVEHLNVLADARDKTGRADIFAKIRTGGVREEMIPSPESVACWIYGCLKRELGFKATAGLHHPIRQEHPLTYETESPLGTMHGFINVLLGICLANAGQITEPQFVELLEERDPAAFQFGDNGATWRGHKVSIEEIQAARNGGSLSFGSCSFTEPVQDLQNLGWGGAFAELVG